MRTACCIVGGGPAGVMAGYMLARAGIEVTVLESHADFFRDFRGDTVHPSTLQVIDELGLLADFLKIKHTEIHELTGKIGDADIVMADFSWVRGRCKFVAFMPQWDLLNFLAERGRRFPNFRLLMNTAATELLDRDGRIVGVKATSPDGPLEIEADLVIGADGRHSTVGERAGLIVESLSSPIDVLWLRLTRRDTDADIRFGRIQQGRMFVTINRDEYWQCAYVIPKGSFEALQAGGIQGLRERIVELVPEFRDRVAELRDWNDVKLLTVTVDRLRTWHRPGLLCIGDAAHAMSPVGGIGINIAIQDAVAAANLLWKPLLEKRATDADLAAVQKRRELAVKLTQGAQVFVQDRILGAVVAGGAKVSVPGPIRMIQLFPVLRKVMGRMVGMGVQPEHVHAPAASA